MTNFFNHIKLVKCMHAILIVACVQVLSGCTKNFEEINTDPTRFTELTPAIIPKAFAKAQYQGI